MALNRRQFLRRTAVGAPVSTWATAAFSLQARAADEQLKVGFAERDITPDVGMEQPGGYGKVFHKIRHDPCKVRASVWDDGQTRVALVGIDALLIRRETVEKVRRTIHERCGIAEEAI